MIINIFLVAGIAILVLIAGIFAFIAAFYKKVPQGKAIVRSGMGGTEVSFDRGIIVIPVLHQHEVMDISVKTIEINRMGKDGLICKDNIRADIKVIFFSRVNKSPDDIKKVAATVGCARTTDPKVFHDLFEAKFSEALKTVARKFDFVELYSHRQQLREEIQTVIGQDLNGFVLDDCAIDYLEQTPVEFLKSDNILDSEGIKKITELTAVQNMQTNFSNRETEKTIKRQNVEARESILELERQLAEKEERQHREIANIKARENAETVRVNEEERLKAERVRIQTSEELAIAEENMRRSIIVAAKNKERTEAVETERVEKDRLLERTEREKVVSLADIEKQRAIETEQKNIQEVIRERVSVQKRVVEEEQKIKDVEAMAAAERLKQVALKEAEQAGETAVIKATKDGEAGRLDAEAMARRLEIEAEARRRNAEKEAEARKISADAKAAEEATIGLAEAQVIEAKASAREKEGNVQANVIERTTLAEARGIEVKAEALKKQGMAEADVQREKGSADASTLELKSLAEAKGIKERILAEAAGIEQKAIAMKQLEGVSREHEEFRLRLEKEKAVELASINIEAEIAQAQASVMAEALKSARIDIVGGDQSFFNTIVQAVSRGKSIDRLVDNSAHLTDIKAALMGDGEGQLLDRVRGLIQKVGLTTDDVRNLTVSALLLKLQNEVGDGDKSLVNNLLSAAQALGLGEKKAGNWLK